MGILCVLVGLWCIYTTFTNGKGKLHKKLNIKPEEDFAQILVREQTLLCGVLLVFLGLGMFSW